MNYGELLRGRQARNTGRGTAACEAARLRAGAIRRKERRWLLVCGDVLKVVGSAYSYGVSGYDGWDATWTRLAVPVRR